MRTRAFLLAALTGLGLAACGGDDDGGSVDALRVDGITQPDSASADGAAATAESEPNDGTTADDVDLVTFPGSIRGAIDPAGDVDVFAATLPAGSRWRLRLDAEEGPFAPHLVVVNHADEAPTSLGLGAAGDVLALEQVIFASGRHNFIVRDARNVPDSTGVGDATHGYTLTAEPLDRAPIAATVPSMPSGTLASPFAVAFYEFTLATETDVRIDVLARRLPSPSSLDTRASLVRLDDGVRLGTNDDLVLGSQLDSRLEGVLPAGSYLLVIDNVDPAATSLGFAVDFALR